MTKALNIITHDVKCVCVCSIKEKMRKLFFLLITPILCFSSLVLILHEFLPYLWRKCIRPTVANMRKLVSNEFIQRRSTKERKRRSYKFFFSVFEKRRFAIIRLIRLVSDSEEINTANLVSRFDKGRRLYLNLDKKTSFSFA